MAVVNVSVMISEPKAEVPGTNVKAVIVSLKAIPNSWPLFGRAGKTIDSAASGASGTTHMKDCTCVAVSVAPEIGAESIVNAWSAMPRENCT